MTREVGIPAAGAILRGTLQDAGDGSALAIFVHGSGSSRTSPRNQAVAGRIRAAGIGTLLFDLLTEEEETVDRASAHLRFDIALLARRLEAVTEWAVAQHVSEWGVAIGYFGASTGAAAALVAAARLGERVSAVVSRGGRPDLAGAALPLVTSPTLLIVGERDPEVHALNEQALSALGGERDIAIVPGATHLFEEPGALDAVARLAAGWLRRYLAAERPMPRTRSARSESRRAARKD